MSGLSDLLALLTAVAALLAGRAAVVNHRARRRLTAAVAGRANGHGGDPATHRAPTHHDGVGPRRTGGSDRDGPGDPPRDGRDRAETNREGDGTAVGGGGGGGHRDGDGTAVGGGHRAPDGARAGDDDRTTAGRGHGAPASWLDAAAAGGGRAIADGPGPGTGRSVRAGSPGRGGPGPDDGRPGPGGQRHDRSAPAGPGAAGWAEFAAGWRSPTGAAGLVLGACAVALVAGVGLVLTGLGLAAAATVAGHARERSAERHRRRAQLPVALDRLASALHGGASVPAALATAGATVPPPLGPELATLAREAEGGRAVADVLDEWADRRNDPGTRLAATALVLAGSIGASPARAARGVAATLRERSHLAEERRSLGSQARLSGLVLSVAPIGFTVLMSATDPATRQFLLHTPAGWACLTVGLALDGAGAWWMSVLTRGTDR